MSAKVVDELQTKYVEGELDFDEYSQAIWGAAIKFKEAQPQADNIASPKLPPLLDVRIYVQGELQKCDFDDITVANAVSIAHEFISRQLSGG